MRACPDRLHLRPDPRRGFRRRPAHNEPVIEPASRSDSHTRRRSATARGSSGPPRGPHWPRPERLSMSGASAGASIRRTSRRSWPRRPRSSRCTDEIPSATCVWANGTLPSLLWVDRPTWPIFYAPLVSDRRNFGAWSADGAHSVTVRANALWKKTLQEFVPLPPAPEVHSALADFVARRKPEAGRPRRGELRDALADWQSRSSSADPPP
jgi:hypothetical protein